MKTLTAVALAAVVVASVSSVEARDMMKRDGMMMRHGTMPSAQGHMMRERQMMGNQMKHGAMLGMGTLSAEGNQNLLYYYGGPCPTAQPVCEPTCAPVCEAPCPPPAPVCEPVCAPVCEPVCEPVCPPKPLCCADFRGWFDGYQCPCPTNYVTTVPCGC